MKVTFTEIPIKQNLGFDNSIVPCLFTLVNQKRKKLESELNFFSYANDLQPLSKDKV